jgi:hypothetical protein
VRKLGFKREDIRDTSPLSLKKLNDTLRYLWLHSFGNIDFADLSESTQGIINNKVGNTTFTQEIDAVNQALISKVDTNGVKSTIEQNPNSVKIGFNNISDKVSVDIKGITIKAGGFNLAANDGTMSGWFADDGSGFSKLKVGELTADNLLTLQTNSISLYVDGTNGNDNNSGTSGAKIRTVNEALRRCNKIFKTGTQIQIYIAGTCSENIIIENFFGDGYLCLNFDSSAVLKGGIRAVGCTCFVDIRGGRDGLNSSVLGALIMPTTGTEAVLAQNCNYVQVYGTRAKLDYANGLRWIKSRGGAIFNDVSGCVYNSALCANDGSLVYMQDNRGSNNTYWGWVSLGGVLISGNSTSVPTSSQGSESTTGKLWISTLTANETQDTSSRPAAQTYTKQWSATATKSWRPSGWRSDNNYIYQGEWSGYGQHRGFMCFDSADIRATLSGATINSMRIYMVRQSAGGNSAAQSLHWYGHGYDSVGGGYDLSQDYGYGGSLSWGQGAWIGLSTTIGNHLRDNTIHGLALYDGSSNYITCTNTPVLEITYTK